jgi:hypothetical protein
MGVVSESLGGRFRVSFSLDDRDPVAAFFLASAIDRGYPELRSENWTTSERSLEAVGKPIIRSASSHSGTVVVEEPRVLLIVSLGESFVYAQAAAADATTAEAALAGVRELLPPPEPSARQEVPVMFWTYSAQGPLPSMRKISVPEWSEIRGNYSESTQAALDGLMQGFRPSHGGQLVLWHGDVGTGKTFALRALAWEWRDWCQIHYIVDPDTFFGEHADYLMSVLMQSGGLGSHVGMMMASHPGAFSSRVMALGPVDFDEDDEEELFDEQPGSDGGDESRRVPQWRLLVLEDTGELLRPDAKTIIGQGLSRFLNVVDGLIGQGLRILVLVTTNEEIGTLHPAVARPGRAAANIEFLPLSRDEAVAWLERHGVDASPPTTRSLASLYALLEGRDPADTRVVGFGE